MGARVGKTDDGGMEPWVLPVVAVAFAALYFLGRNETVRRVLTCPLRKISAEIQIVQRYQRPDKPVRVKTCSLFADPRRVDCSQACIHESV